MTKSNQPFAQRIFRRLLRLLPFDFRWDYGREMETVFLEEHREAEREEGPRGLLRHWGRPRPGPAMFHNVYLHPAAYQHYSWTGTFPEKTMLALAMYQPSQKDSVVRGGYFEGDLMALEMALKDSERFEEDWAYFNFSHDGRLLDRAQAFPPERCHSCHAERGADDNVFVQSYPVLRRLKQTEESQR